MTNTSDITNLIDLKDLIVTPIFLLAIAFFINIFIHRNISDPVLRKYFIYGLNIKIAGAIAFGLIYQYYYSGAGDTALYYALGGEINSIIISNPWEGLKLLAYPEASEKLYNLSMLLGQYKFDRSTFLIGRISGFFSLFCFNTYTSISILFAMTSFYGIWKLFKLLYSIFPEIRKEMAVAFLFYPSIIFWGSGIMKDGVALSALCMGFYSLYCLFYSKTGKVKYLLGLIFSLYLMSYIKIYITLCFIPTGFLWIFSSYSKSIKSNLLRWISWPIVIGLGLTIGIYSAALITQDDAKYSLDKIAETAQITSAYLTRISINQEGSFYTLGDYEPTLAGMLPKLFPAIWVTLYRPYIWEIRNPLMLLSALESMLLFILTANVLFKTGIIKTFNIITESPFLIFCATFTIVFAFSVGISTYNFGTLVRYKIPLLPFFITLLFYIKNYRIIVNQRRF